MQEKIKAGYKQSEIGVIPEDWTAASIKSLCELVNGRGFKPYEWKQRGLPIIRIQNLNGSDEFNHFDGAFNPKILIEPGELLFAWSGSRGTSFGPHVWRGPTALLNYHTWKVATFDKRIDRTFFFHALRHLTKSIEDEAHGASALVHTQKKEMENFLIPSPSSITEQQAIAEALSDADARIAALEALIAKKRDLKQAAMQQLLTGKTRLSGFSGDWEVKCLKDVALVFDGTHQTPLYVSHGVPFYSVENVTSGDFKNTKFITSEEHKILTRSVKLERGDILMTRIGSIGDCKLIGWDVCASFYVSLALIKVKKGTSAKYIEQYSKTEEFQKEVEVNSLMQAIPKKINLGPISRLIIKIPPTEAEQIAIADILSDMDAELAALEAEAEKARTIKQGMMQNLLTGKVRLV